MMQKTWMTAININVWLHDLKRIKYQMYQVLFEHAIYCESDCNGYYQGQPKLFHCFFLYFSLYTYAFTNNNIVNRYTKLSPNTHFYVGLNSRCCGNLLGINFTPQVFLFEIDHDRPKVVNQVRPFIAN